MHSHPAPFTATLLAALILASSTLAYSASGEPGELLVGLRPGASQADLDAILREEGGIRVKQVGHLGVHRVRVTHGDRDVLRHRIEKRREVEFVEPNALVSPDAIPNDSEYVNEWHLAKIGAPAAWDTTVGSTAIVVAVLDSGIAAGHEDFQGKLVAGWNFNDDNADTTDLSGHGTMVAGVVAPATNNAIGVSGVTWASPLMPVRVTLPDGTAYLSTIATGLVWAADHGARVMNVSFSDVAGSATIRSAAQYVQSKGGVVVASAGNCACTDPTAENPYVISVAATDSADGVKSFSSRGAYVDIAAPGTLIRTTAQKGDYVYNAGTSFASPIVGGVVALMMAVNPHATPTDLEAWLKETALDIDVPGYDPASGAGRVRADLAVAAAASSAPPPADVTPPAASIQSPASGSTVGGAVSVEVLAFDDRAVASVSLFIDGALTAVDDSSPYSFVWATDRLPDGNHSLVAVAFDTAGNHAPSSTVSVTTSNATDQTPPTALVKSPGDGSSISRYVDIIAQGTDNKALARLEVLVDGTAISSAVCTGTSCSMTTRWNPKRTKNNSHQIRARATDAAGQVTLSTPVSVTVR